MPFTLNACISSTSLSEISLAFRLVESLLNFFVCSLVVFSSMVDLALSCHTSVYAAKCTISMSKVILSHLYSSKAPMILACICAISLTFLITDIVSSYRFYLISRVHFVDYRPDTHYLLQQGLVHS